jgi:hypothetical protein
VSLPVASLFEKLLREALAEGTGHARVCAGTGIGISHNQNTTDGMIGQMTISRAAGADGVIFYPSSSLAAPFLARLRSTR